MQNIAKKSIESQEESKFNNTEFYVEQLPSGPEFFEMLDEQLRHLARITIINTIQDEFEKFIGVGPYQRSDERSDYRNGTRYRNFETRFGLIKDIPIPRARKSNFVSKLFDRWIRREKKITRAIAEMFIHGISTRKVKKITKAIWGKEYSAATASRCTKVLQEDYIKWMNRPISKKIRYLFLDGINLKLRRHWISNESLLPKVPVQRCIVHKIRNNHYYSRTVGSIYSILLKRRLKVCLAAYTNIFQKINQFVDLSFTMQLT